MLQKIIAILQITLARVRLKIQRTTYQGWIRRHERDILETEPLLWQPLISVIVPVYNVERELLEACVESVRGQTYPNWELCMADDASTMDCVRETLKEYGSDERISVVWRSGNGHISRATNSALELAKGEFVAFLDCDDMLAPHALYEVVKMLNRHPGLDLLYSDEDKIDEAGTRRRYPHFKTGWSPDTLMSMMYTGHLGVYRRSIVEELGGLRVGYEGAQDYDLTLRFTERTDRIAHVPGILYHWRESARSTSADAGAKPYVMEAQRKAKEDALRRRGLAGRLEYLEGLSQFRVHYLPVKGALVSIILCSSGAEEKMCGCIDALKGETSWKGCEWLIAGPGRLPDTVRRAKGEFLLFLADDLEMITADGIERMAGHAGLAHVGAVGAKILYPDGHTICHCGVEDKPEGIEWILQGRDDRVVYDPGANRVDRNVPAVAGGCLMITREKYQGLAGGEMKDLTSGSQIGLCRCLRERGYHNVLRKDVIFHRVTYSQPGFGYCSRQPSWP